MSYFDTFNHDILKIWEWAWPYFERLGKDPILYGVSILVLIFILIRLRYR